MLTRRRFLASSILAPILSACDGSDSKLSGGIPVGASSQMNQNVKAAETRGRMTAGKNGQFLLDGKPFVMAAGELHPGRIPYQYWDQRIKAVKSIGFNTISIYDFWSEHEADYDEALGPTFDFKTDEKNLPAFLDLCKSNDMWVFLRPGPFVDAFWDLGGIPGYLLKNDGIVLRSSTDPVYMAAVERYVAALAPIIKPRLSNASGPILMVQVENEYTSYAYDKNYLSTIRALWQKYGIGVDGNVLLSTNNGISDGTVWGGAGALTDQPIGGDPLYAESVVALYANYKQPIFGSEIYSGWDTLADNSVMYGDSSTVTNCESIAPWIKAFIKEGISFSVYVAHGGTSFAYGASGSYDASNGIFNPNVTSYDYRAPINEQGDKAYNIPDNAGVLSLSSYDRIREVFQASLQSTPPTYTLIGPLDSVQQAGTRGTYGTIPAMTKPSAMISLPADKIQLDIAASIWDNLPIPIKSTTGAVSCEAAGMYAGCGAVYSTQTPEIRGIKYLTIQSLADVATVFVNGVLAAIIDRRTVQGVSMGSVLLKDTSSNRRSVVRLDFGDIARSATIEIFVYTFGHTHKEFTGQKGDNFRKGMWGQAWLTDVLSPAPSWITLSNWNIYPLPMTSTSYPSTLKPLTSASQNRAGMFFSARFNLEAVGDTYIDVSTWNLGVVWVNGHNIGRHFAASGPQKALFCPAVWLRTGANEIVIFDNYVTDLSKVSLSLSNIRSTYDSRPQAT